jgi:hypothetical protein
VVTPTTRFRCADDVIAKVMDGEAVIINLTNGMYYSTDKVGAVIWSLLESGHSVSEAAEKVATCYETAADRAASDISQLVSQLLEERLLLPCEDRQAPAAEIDSASRRESYEPPALQIYSDMGDLLALDPPMPSVFGVTPWKDPRRDPSSE